MTAGAIKYAAESAFASGCAVGAVLCRDVAQQVLFAQQFIWQAFSLGPCARMQLFAGRRVDAANIASVTQIAAVTLVSISELIA